MVTFWNICLWYNHKNTHTKMCDWRCFTEIWGAKSWKFFNFPFKNLQGLPIATGSYVHADIVDYLKLSSYQYQWKGQY